LPSELKFGRLTLELTWRARAADESQASRMKAALSALRLNELSGAARRCCTDGRGGGASAQFGCVTNRMKRLYGVRNWRDYSKALVARGSLTVRVDPRSTDTWLEREWPARR
jgi:hypothetical protein